MSDNEDEKVGYRRPPTKNQFQPGQSGNPKGRPKRQVRPKDESLRAILKRVGERTVVLNGEEVTLRELEIIALQGKAAKGDPPSVRLLNKLRDEAGLNDKSAGGGVLVVPAPMNMDEWSAAAAMQQAKFRDASYCDPYHDGDKIRSE